MGQVEVPLLSLNGNVAIKQWWPFAPRDDSDKNVTGKINLELQLITDAVRLTPNMRLVAWSGNSFPLCAFSFEIF